jgi:hypothetical protein
MRLSRFSSDSSQIDSDPYKKEKETPKHQKNLLYTILNLGKIKQKNTEKIYVIWRKQLSQTMTVYNLQASTLIQFQKCARNCQRMEHDRQFIRWRITLQDILREKCIQIFQNAEKSISGHQNTCHPNNSR